MADESGDLDIPAGYIDDDIDLDDDDDEPLTNSVRPLNAAAASQAPAKKPRITPAASSASAADAAARADEQPQAGDFLLRPGAQADRDLILARFLNDMPELETAERIRFYREREGTEKGREAGLKHKRKQDAYYNSYSGKRRLERYALQGLRTVPDRVRKSWMLEVSKEGTTPSTPPPPVLRGEVQTYAPEADIFKGVFDGQVPSSYALMVMQADGRHVDVVPVGPHAWYTFRNARPGGASNADEATNRMKKVMKKGENRLGHFTEKYEEAQERREGLQGGISRFEEKRGVVTLGIRRKVNSKIEAEKASGGEFMDFEQEFDNDDVAQVDRDEVEKKSERREFRDPKKVQDNIQKLIKDEAITDAPKSPVSDSEDDDEKGPSRSPSPPRPNPGSRSISPARQLSGARPPAGRASATPGAATASAARPPSALRSQPASRAGTPQLLEFKDILPAPGVLPNEGQVVAVIKRLCQQKGSLKLKDLLPYFDRNTKEQKANLMKIVKHVGQLREDPPGSKNYILALKKAWA